MQDQIHSLNFQLGVLHLVHLLTIADGNVDERERRAISNMIANEHIPKTVVDEFQMKVLTMTEKDLFHDGLAYLNLCTDHEKIRAFVYLYQLSEVDDQVHVREVRLLLYSLKAAHIEFNEVERIARESRKE